MEWLGPYLPALMFASLAILLFSGYPVAFVLGGIGLGFGFLAYFIDPWLFDLTQFGALPPRIFGAIAENLILTAIPMFIFMGTMLEKSGVARDLLNCLQVLLRRVPGGLALAVTLMGTILAATTGIIGASVVMMSLLALPVMIGRGYSASLSTGTIAASGTLGILIPPRSCWSSWPTCCRAPSATCSWPPSSPASCSPRSMPCTSSCFRC